MTTRKPKPITETISLSFDEADTIGATLLYHLQALEHEVSNSQPYGYQDERGQWCFDLLGRTYMSFEQLQDHMHFLGKLIQKVNVTTDIIAKKEDLKILQEEKKQF